MARNYNSTDEMMAAEGGDSPEARRFAAGNGYWYSPAGERYEGDWLGWWEQDEEYVVPLGYIREERGAGWYPPGHPVFVGVG